MTRRHTIAILMMAIVALIGVLMSPVALVRVTSENGVAILCERVSRSSRIALTFTHSMYGGNVTETFTPGDRNTIERTSIVTDNAAAAEYYAWDGAVRENDGQYEVIVPDQVFGALPIRVDDIGNHQLAIDEETYSLVGMVEGSTRVWLGITTRPLLTRVLGSRC